MAARDNIKRHTTLRSYYDMLRFGSAGCLFESDYGTSDYDNLSLAVDYDISKVLAGSASLSCRPRMGSRSVPVLPKISTSMRPAQKVGME